MSERNEMWEVVERLAEEAGNTWVFTPIAYEGRIMRHREDGFLIYASYHPWAPHRMGEGNLRHLLDLDVFPEGIRLTDEEYEACRAFTSQNFRQSQAPRLEPGEVRGQIDIMVRCDVVTPHGPDLVRRMAPWFERSANEMRGLVRKVMEMRGMG
jgi:hypothetical protein